MHIFNSHGNATAVENDDFLTLRRLNEQRSTIRQNKLNSLILNSLEQRFLTGRSPPQGASINVQGARVLTRFAKCKVGSINLPINAF